MRIDNPRNSPPSRPRSRAPAASARRPPGRGEAVGSVGRRAGQIGPRITRRRLESVPNPFDSPRPLRFPPVGPDTAGADPTAPSRPSATPGRPRQGSGPGRRRRPGRGRCRQGDSPAPDHTSPRGWRQGAIAKSRRNLRRPGHLLSLRNDGGLHPAINDSPPPGIGPTGPSAGLAAGPDRPAAPAWGLERGQTLCKGYRLTVAEARPC